MRNPAERALRRPHAWSRATRIIREIASTGNSCGWHPSSSDVDKVTRYLIDIDDTRIPERVEAAMEMIKTTPDGHINTDVVLGHLRRKFGDG